MNIFNEICSRLPKIENPADIGGFPRDSPVVGDEGLEPPTSTM